MTFKYIAIALCVAGITAISQNQIDLGGSMLVLAAGCTAFFD